MIKRGEPGTGQSPAENFCIIVVVQCNQNRAFAVQIILSVQFEEFETKNLDAVVDLYVTEGDDKSMSTVADFVILSSAEFVVP
jgi:hypothetical protein